MSTALSFYLYLSYFFLSPPQALSYDRPFNMNEMAEALCNDEKHPTDDHCMSHISKLICKEKFKVRLIIMCSTVSRITTQQFTYTLFKYNGEPSLLYSCFFKNNNGESSGDLTIHDFVTECKYEELRPV